jgi:ribosomal protein S18 acetylase RimI-like enzyme
MPQPALSLRPIGPDDEAFLYLVYASTRAEELALVPWTDEEREAFLRQQFSAQHRHFREHYPGAVFQLILRDGAPVGRLYVDRSRDEIRVVDLALLPEHRGAGIGTSLLRDLLAEAAAAGKPITLHVERFNPALRLYWRLGFRQIADRGVYLFLGWSPPPGQEKTAS